MKLRILSATLLLVWSGGCVAPSAVTNATTRSYTVGDQTIQAVTSGPAGSGLVFLNLHDNENTSVEAAQDVLSETGGRVTELRHTGERLISFRLGGQTFVFDPNRMFTDAGARRTLEREGAVTEAALQAIRGFADRLLADHDLDAAPVIVTLHNNTEANYSAESYAEGGTYATDAAAVHLTPGTDVDDFFFVTDRRLYDALAARNFNVVLQDNEQATDDGSLSVFAGQRALPYVNVEAQHGHRREQAAMIGALVDVLRAGGFIPASD